MADRKPEQQLWDSLSRRMVGWWTAERVENRFNRDMPDVFFTFPRIAENRPGFCGWIELKQIPKWGLQQNRITTVRHFTAGQKRWLREKHISNGNAWLLLHVRMTNEYVFLPGDRAGCVGESNRERVLLRAEDYFHGLPTPATIHTVLETGIR